MPVIRLMPVFYLNNDAYPLINANLRIANIYSQLVD